MKEKELLFDALLQGPIKKNRVFCFTDSDLDGTGCATLFHYFFEDVIQNPNYKVFQVAINIVAEKYKSRSHQEFTSFLDQLVEGDVVIFSDLIPDSAEHLNQICAKKALPIIFDHHPTSYESLGNFDTYMYDTSRSSCKLVWDFFSRSFGILSIPMNNVAQKFSTLVNTYDLWKDTDELWTDARNLNSILWRDMGQSGYSDNGYTIFINRNLKKIRNQDEYSWLPTEELFIEKNAQQEEEEYQALKKKRAFGVRTDTVGQSYIYCEGPRKLSYFCNRLLKEYGVDYVVAKNTFTAPGEPKRNMYSLRCREEFNVKDIAEKYKGGGHVRAAGLELLDDQLVNDLRKGTHHLV